MTFWKILMYDITFVFQEAWLSGIYDLEVLDGIKMWIIKSSIPFSTVTKNKLKYASDEYLDCTIKTKNINYNGKIIFLGNEHLFYIFKEE